jgi:sugar fermentation stimulation protein A
LLVAGTKVLGQFVSRLNRFTVIAKINTINNRCYLPNPGRLSELLIPGIQVLLIKQPQKKRKTRYDLFGVYYQDQWVIVDSRLPNKLIFEALLKKTLKPFSQYRVIRPEVTYRRSRFDFFLATEDERCFIEVKSCTLAHKGIGLFPDAPTRRGTRHIRELIRAKEEGYRTSIIFIIQRPDVTIITTNDKTDPEFCASLREADYKGVEIYAYSTKYDDDEVILGCPVLVQLGS